MRERVKNIGGVLEIKSDQAGTRVKAIVPLASELQKDGGARKASVTAR
jgi:signal transduction histidine kinase